MERALHETYFALYDIQPETAKMPACFAYTNYLLATTSLQSIAVGAAAVLPCFWIYRQVGKHIYERAIQENPYRSWIDTYAGDAFDQSVNQMLALTDKYAETAGASGTSQRCGKHFGCRVGWNGISGMTRIHKIAGLFEPCYQQAAQGTTCPD